VWRRKNGMEEEVAWIEHQAAKAGKAKMSIHEFMFSLPSFDVSGSALATRSLLRPGVCEINDWSVGRVSRMMLLVYDPPPRSSAMTSLIETPKLIAKMPPKVDVPTS
jgi:hypothetical protein